MTRLFLILCLTAAPTLAQEDGSVPATPANPQPAVTPAAQAPQPVPAENPAKAKLRAAAAAIKAASSLSFRLKTSATGGFGDMAPVFEGQVLMARPEGDTVNWNIRITGEGKNSKAAPTLNLDAAFFGQTYSEWVDHPNKKLIRKLRTQANRVAEWQLANQARVTVLSEAQPFSQALREANAQLVAPADADGVACAVVETWGSNDATKSRWFIGESDNLLRRYERISTLEFASGTQVVELTKVAANNPLTLDQIKVALPPGYDEDPIPTTPKPSTPVTPDAGSTIAKPDSDGNGVKPTPGPAPATAPTGPLGAGKPAPLWELPSSANPPNGKTSLEALRGSPVLIMFWGTWSLPARNALPELRDLSTRYANVKLVTLAVRERNTANPRTIMDKANLSAPALVNAEPVAKDYAVRSYPTFILIDDQGNIAATFEGFRAGQTMGQIAEAIQRLK